MLDAIHKHDSSFTENAVFLSLPMIFFHYLESCGLLQAACDVFYWSNMELANYRNATFLRRTFRNTKTMFRDYRTCVRALLREMEISTRQPTCTTVPRVRAPELQPLTHHLAQN